MSKDWKQFFKPLWMHRPESQEPHGFSPESFLSAQLQCLRPPGSHAATTPMGDFLETQPVERLFDLDERLRSYHGLAFRDWPDHMLADIAASTMGDSMRQSLLFLAAGHGNGRMRERALTLLPDFPGKLTLAAALIRCADWVPMVRKMAQQTATRLLDLCQDGDLIDVWPLAIRLASRERLDREWFSRCVEGRTLRGEPPQLLITFLQSPNTAVRTWAYEKALDMSVPLGFDLLGSAIRDASPRIALSALRYSADRGSEARTRELASFGIKARHPVIRRESLRMLAKLDASLPREVIHGMLGDKSAGVRSLAAFLLKERYSEEAIEYWREIIDSDVHRPTLGALISLVDRAREEDIPRFKRWLPYPRGLVRLWCMRGLLRAGGGFSDEEFLDLLSTPSEKMHMELADSIRKGKVRLDTQRLMAALAAETGTSTTRKHLRALMRELGHWDRLALILSIQPSGEHELLWRAAALGDWIADSGRYAPLGETRRSSLLALLEDRRGEMDEAAYREIGRAISRH